jgi:hypothetical protein
MGAFNEWVRDSFLEVPENRRFETVALNLLYWSAVLQRTALLRSQGLKLSAVTARPLEPDVIREMGTV